jgi:hypothetical protein
VSPKGSLCRSSGRDGRETAEGFRLVFQAVEVALEMTVSRTRHPRRLLRFRHLGIRLALVAKPHKHFFNVTMTQASWKKATNILI